MRRTKRKKYPTALALATTADYVKEHFIYSRGNHPMVADRFETPFVVNRTLTYIYGTPRIPGDGETAFWMIDDQGAALGLKLR